MTRRYEYKINEPDRSHLAKVNGRGVIAYDPETPGFVKGQEPNPTYPGLAPVNSRSSGNPKKAQSGCATLEIYASAVVGSECRFTQDGKVAILQGQNVIGVGAQDQVLIVGSEKRTLSRFATRHSSGAQ